MERQELWVRIDRARSEQKTALDLSGLGLQELPPEAISQLKSLISLNLSYNQIAKIPESLQHCQKLEKLGLQGSNPLPIEPAVLASEHFWETVGDAQAILSFYFQTQTPGAAEPWYEAKFLCPNQKLYQRR